MVPPFPKGQGLSRGRAGAANQRVHSLGKAESIALQREGRRSWQVAGRLVGRKEFEGTASGACPGDPLRKTPSFGANNEFSPTQEETEFYPLCPSLIPQI